MVNFKIFKSLKVAWYNQKLPTILPVHSLPISFNNKFHFLYWSGRCILLHEIGIYSYTVQLNLNLIITHVWQVHNSTCFQTTKCMHACSLKIDDVLMLVKSIVTTCECMRFVIFCRVYLLKHAHEWLSHEILECCSANYHASCVSSDKHTYFSIKNCEDIRSLSTVYTTIRSNFSLIYSVSRFP